MKTNHNSDWFHHLGDAARRLASYLPFPSLHVPRDSMSSLPVASRQAHSYVGGIIMLNESLYRELAGQWHSGKCSAMYLFASTGIVQPSLASEIVECFGKTGYTKELRRLECLYAAVGPSITVESIQTSSEFWHRTLMNYDGSPVRCRANGKVKLWKTRPTEFRLPVNGLFECFYLTQGNASEWTVAPMSMDKYSIKRLERAVESADRWNSIAKMLDLQ
jgi:hypothetical protein